MFLKIVGFKCYPEFAQEVSQGELVLLKGPSGIGKSTIFHSLTWLLYGTLRGVDPRTDKKEQLNVTLEFQRNGETVSIYRQKRPGLLQIGSIEGDLAQATVNDLFVDHRLWPVAGYIAQGQHNSFLSMPNTEKMELLNLIAFNDEDPDVFIDKIDQEICSANSSFNLVQMDYTKGCEEFTRFINENTIDTTKAVVEDKLISMKVELNRLSKEISQLKLKQLEYQRQMGILSSLEENLKNIESRIANVKIPTYNEREIQGKITELEAELSQLKMSDSYRKELGPKLIEINNIVSQNPNIQFKNYTQDDLQNSLVKKELYTKSLSGRQLVSSYRIEYSQQGISQEISRLTKIIDNQPDLRVKKEYQEISEKITHITTPDTSISDVDEIKQEYQHLIQMQDIITCPHCNKGVRYSSGKLMKGNDGELSVSQQEIQMVKNRLAQITENYNKTLEKQNLIAQLSKLKPQDFVFQDELLSSKELLSIKDKISSLSRITFAEPPEVPPEEIQLFLKWKKLTIEKESLDSKIIDGSSDKIRDEIAKHRNLIQELHQSKTTLDILTRQRVETVEKISTIKRMENIDQTLEIIILKEKNLTMTYNDAIVANKALEMKRVLEKKREVLVDLQNKIINLQKFKQMAIDAECSIMQQTVDSMNGSLADILLMMFDEPITVTISLYKTVKTTQKVKPVVNVAIFYKGCEYDSVLQLSGGEGDRISLGITLAFNMVTGCPILLLDETLASLDGNIRESCLKAIREFTIGKTVMCIAHNDVEGLYDQVISLA